MRLARRSLALRATRISQTTRRQTAPGGRRTPPATPLPDAEPRSDHAGISTTSARLPLHRIDHPDPAELPARHLTCSRGHREHPGVPGRYLIIRADIDHHARPVTAPGEVIRDVPPGTTGQPGWIRHRRDRTRV